MSSLEAVASEEAESSHHQRLWKAWVCGQGEAFHAELLRLQVDLWAADLLHSWMPDVLPTHEGRVQQFPVDPTEHYKLMCTLLDAAMTANPAYWDTDQMRRWMDVLVERQYPWFVCSVWTRHRTEAVSLLHASSLTHHHTSNLHNLLHKGLIPNLWFEADDFLESLDAQVTFFKTLPTGRRGRGWRRELYAQFVHYPYDRADCVVKTVQAIIQTGNVPLLQCFLTQPDARRVWPAHRVLLARLCIDDEHVEMLEWVLEMYETRCITLTVTDWYNLACRVHPYHLTRTLHRNFKSAQKYRMLRLLLVAFDARMPKSAWLHLFTYTVREHSFANLLVYTHKGAALLEYAWTKVCEAAADIRDVYVLESVDELRDVRLTPELCADPKRFFRTLEALTKNAVGWTALANALRWGSAPVVKWLVEHGADINVLCTTGDATHNTLSLACYNQNERVLTYLLELHHLGAWLLHWLLGGARDIVSALTRYTVPEHVSLSRFRRVVAIHTRMHALVAYDHYEDPSDILSRKIAGFKTNLMRIVADQLHQREYVHTTDARAASRPPPTPRVLFGQRTPVFVHPMIQVVLDMSGTLDADTVVDLFVQCKTRAECEALYHHVGMADVARTRRLHSLYELLVYEARQPRRCEMPVECLRVMEECPVFVREMRTSASMARIRVTSAWVLHPMPLFEAFLERARNEWHWYLGYDLNHLIDWYPSKSDAQYAEKWYLLLSRGHYPLLASLRDGVYQRTAKALRCVQRYVRRRVRKFARGHRVMLPRVHWELGCVLADPNRPVLQYVEGATRARLMAGASL